MFVIETVDELGSKASVHRLHEQRPTAGVLLQQPSPLLGEGRFEPVEDRIGSHIALWHEAKVPQRITHREIAADTDSLRLKMMDFDLSVDQVALQSAARELLSAECSIERVRAAAQTGGFDAALWAAMIDQGWTAIAAMPPCELPRAHYKYMAVPNSVDVWMPIILRVAESALQVHGGIGFTWESDVHLYLKRAQLDQTAFGDARHHRERLAAMLTKRLESGGSVLT